MSSSLCDSDISEEQVFGQLTVTFFDVVGSSGVEATGMATTFYFAT